MASLYRLSATNSNAITLTFNYHKRSQEKLCWIATIFASLTTALMMNFSKIKYGHITVFWKSVFQYDWIISSSHSKRGRFPQQLAQRTKVGVFDSHTKTRDITCFRTPQLCMLSTSSHMSLSIPFSSIQWRSVWDLCALNNAVLKGQEGDEERVNA